MELFTSLNLTVRGFVVVTIITFQILHADTQMKCLGWKWKLFKYKLFLQGQWNCRICNNSDTAMGDIRCLLCSSVAPSVSVGYGHHWYVWYLSRRIVISTVIVSSYQGCTSFSLIREPIKKWPGHIDGLSFPCQLCNTIFWTRNSLSYKNVTKMWWPWYQTKSVHPWYGSQKCAPRPWPV